MAKRTRSRIVNALVHETCERVRFLQIHQDQNAGGKRQGDSLQDPNQKRRAAFGDITNVSSYSGIFFLYW